VSLWLLLVIGVALAIALLAVGVLMVRPSWGDRGTRADVGVAVITTTVISLAIFVLQVLDENRLQRDDAHRADQAANQALRLQLGLSSRLKSMDLHGQDLSGINLPQRNLVEANFSDADLSGANFAGANLQGTHFDDAHLEGANLGAAHLNGAFLDGAHLDGQTNLNFADLTGASLVGTRLEGASLYNAHLSGVNAAGANLIGATIDGSAGGGLQYNSRTVFPNGRTRPCPPSKGLCTLTAKQWLAEHR
jgi:uncharacterized protein YjbI with pentapeptide repeats